MTFAKRRAVEGRFWSQGRQRRRLPVAVAAGLCSLRFRVSDPQPTLPRHPGCSWDQSFAALKRLGFAPRRIIDVGANHGRWTRTALEYFPDAEYLLVEPQAHLVASVQDLIAAGRSIRWFPVGVGGVAGRRLLTIAPDDVSSNFGMTAEDAQAHGYSQAEVDVVTIDALVRECGGDIPEMVKIDAEGMELEVLDGAKSLLGRSEVFFLEAAVCATGIANTLASIVGRMEGAGYQVIDITDLNRSPTHGVLWLCELVFVRKGSVLISQLTGY